MELLLDKGAAPNTEIKWETALRYVMNYFADESEIKYRFDEAQKDESARKIADMLRRHGAREYIKRR